MWEGVAAPERDDVSVRGPLPSLVVVADAARLEHLGSCRALLEDVKRMAVLVTDLEEFIRAQVCIVFLQLVNAIGILIDFITKTFYCIIEIVEFSI